MTKHFGAAQPQIQSYDPMWDRVRREAEETSANEPVLASPIYATILSEPTLEDAICHTVALRLQPSVDTGLLNKTFREVLVSEPADKESERAAALKAHGDVATALGKLRAAMGKESDVGEQDRGGMRLAT